MEFLIWLAVLPSLVIGILIYKADSREKEPIRELVKAFFMGILSVILTLVISYIIGVNDISLDTNNFLNVAVFAFLSISLIEESSKWLCSYLFLRKNKNFDYLFDGIVYTTFVSLGFATIENILYTISGGIMTGIIRAITTVPAHAFFGITSGYYLSLAKKNNISNKKLLKNKYLFLSIFIPFVFHGFYDFCLLTQNEMLFIVYIIFVIILYSFSIYRVKKMMKMEERFVNNKKLYCSNCGMRVDTPYCANCGKKID